MISIGSNGERIAYGIKHYNLDTEADLLKLPRTRQYMGCTCFVISTSKYYMLNSEHKWIEITPFGQVASSNGTGGGAGDSGNTNPDPTPPTDDDIVYEGGEI